MSPYPSELIAAWLVAVACVAAIALMSNVALDSAEDHIISPSEQVAAQEARSTLDGHSILEFLKGDRDGESGADSH